MTELVAQLWWEGAHEGLVSRHMFADSVITFGRSQQCDITWGRLPVYDQHVPGVWGQLTWTGDRLQVANVDDVFGFEVVSLTRDGADDRRVQVLSGDAHAPGSRDLRIEARGREAAYALRVLAATRSVTQTGTLLAGDVTWAPQLNEAQAAICRAVRGHAASGQSRRASYEQVAALTNYSLRYVRQLVAQLDALFLVNGLIDVGQGGDMLDRVSLVVLRHRLAA